MRDRDTNDRLADPFPLPFPSPPLDPVARAVTAANENGVTADPDPDRDLFINPSGRGDERSSARSTRSSVDERDRWGVANVTRALGLVLVFACGAPEVESVAVRSPGICVLLEDNIRTRCVGLVVVGDDAVFGAESIGRKDGTIVGPRSVLCIDGEGPASVLTPSSRERVSGGLRA